MQRWMAIAVVMGLALMAIGCGGSGRPRLVKVQGKVTLDGQPLEGAQVALLFVTTEKGKYQRPSRATTDPGGAFTPQTYGNDDGLPVGKYKVGVIKREIVGNLPANFSEENPEASNVKYKWTTPREYADPASSGLEVEVTSSGLKPETIDLKTNGKPPEIELTGPQKRANDP
ncbi:carboxypeptidase-like regulatory domain-containing protein [Planctellipticum variicoloris]|uniref:carboxypeptidase-like regulatory domain-containing protein n=1 Tax=Planctellipticum variicoloris TaxID=3064265 RepID=UPI003013B575|nr:carboxypeptidase-like regulatory domain-containing protein [Planctomycetaceae bacterium SH412]